MINHNTIIFDYFMFVQIWPSAWILNSNNTMKHEFDNSYFSVHGIWPEYYNGSWPSYCDSKEKFNVTKLNDIETKLKKYWTNFINPSEFWKHQFLKHLTCTDSSNPYIYFWYGLKLREKYNLFSILRQNDIIPSNNKLYETKLIQNVINNQINKKIILNCNENNILSEIKICFDKSFNVIDCPSVDKKYKCTSDFISYPIV